MADFIPEVDVVVLGAALFKPLLLADALVCFTGCFLTVLRFIEECASCVAPVLLLLAFDFTLVLVLVQQV